MTKRTGIAVLAQHASTAHEFKNKTLGLPQKEEERERERVDIGTVFELWSNSFMQVLYTWRIDTIPGGHVIWTPGCTYDPKLSHLAHGS